MEIVNKNRTGANLDETVSEGTMKHYCDDKSLDTCSNEENLNNINIAPGQIDVLLPSVKWDKQPSGNCDQLKYGLDGNRDSLPKICWSVDNEQIQRNGESNQDESILKYRLLKSDAEANAHQMWKSIDMSCKSSPGQDKSAKGSIKTKLKLINGNRPSSKSVKPERHQSNGLSKYNKHYTNKQIWNYCPPEIKNQACSLFEEQLQELESHTANKCLKLKFRKKKIKKEILKTPDGDKKWTPFGSIVTLSQADRIEKKNTTIVKSHYKQIKSDRHFHGEGHSISKRNKVSTRPFTKKKHHIYSAERNITLNKNQQDIAEDKKNLSEIKKEHSEEKDRISDTNNKTINCQNRCYRLQSAQWNGSTKCVLRLLKRKYRSVRNLFSKNPVLALHKVSDRKIKMIGENFQVISMWEAETDSSVCTEDLEVDKEANSEGGNLVDPRVMSLSRALESGLNGKVGAEKTFKNLSSKTSQAKTKVCLKLEAIKSSTKKTIVQKPDWSKLKQKLKEVNEKQILQKKKDGIIVGRDVGRIPVLTRNPLKGCRDHAKPPLELESNKSITENSDTQENSESIIQERKKELEKLCTGSESVADIEFDKEVVDEESTSSNTLEEFQEMLSDQDIDIDTSFKIGEYSIEICRDSPDDGQFMEPNEDRNQYQIEEDTEDIETSAEGCVETKLTVTSGIIPNLYISVGQPIPGLDEGSRSPPTLIREFESEPGEGVFYVKEVSSPSESAFDEQEERDVSRKACIDKLDNSQKHVSQYELSGDSNAKVNSEETNDKSDGTLALQIKNVCTLKNAQFIHSQKTLVHDTISDNSTSIIHNTTSTDNPDKEFHKDISPESDISFSSLSHITDALLSDSAETLNYSELTENELADNADNTLQDVFVDTVDHRQDKVVNRIISSEAQPDKADIGDDNINLVRSLSSSSLSSSSSTIIDKPDLDTFDTHAMYSNNQPGSVNNFRSDEKDENKPSSVCNDSKVTNIEQSIPSLDNNTNKQVAGAQLKDLTMDLATSSSLKKEHRDEGVPIRKTSENKEKLGKSNRKRKKSLEKNYMLENDSEDLPRITPPKRRHRPLSNASSTPTEDFNQERLMQDFPKHNWLFNKYSFVSKDLKSMTKKDDNLEAGAISIDGSASVTSAENLLNMMEEKETRAGHDAGQVTAGCTIIGTGHHLSQTVSSTKITLSVSSSPSLTLSTAGKISSPSVAFSMESMNTFSPLEAISVTSNSLSLPATSLSPSGQVTFTDSSSHNGKTAAEKGNHGSDSSSVNQQTSLPGSPSTEIFDGKNGDNEEGKIDVLERNANDRQIDLHYTRQTTLKSSTGKDFDLKTKTTIDQCALRQVPAYQSLKLQEDLTSFTHTSRSCNNTHTHIDAIKTGEFTQNLMPLTEKKGTGELRNTHKETDFADHSHDAVEIRYDPALKIGNRPEGVLDNASVNLDSATTEVGTTNVTGNASQSKKEVVSMITEKVGLDGGCVEEVDGTSHLQSHETASYKQGSVGYTECSNTVDLSVDTLKSTQPYGKMAPLDQCTGKQGTVESGGLSFRQKPNPPVLRVQPHLYKPPRSSKSASPEPQIGVSNEHGINSTEMLASTDMTPSLPNSSKIQAPSRTHGETSNNDRPQNEYAQKKTSVVLSSHSSAVISHSHSGMNLHSKRSPRESNKTEVVPVPSLPLSASSNGRNSNTGMVNPVQPIIQTLDLVSHQGNIQHAPAALNSLQAISTNNHILTSQTLNSAGSRRTILPRPILPLTSTQFLGQTQSNQSYVYHQPPAIIQVQTPSINPAQLFEINPITQITPLPQTNQVYLIDSGNSVIPITSTMSNTISHNPGQQVFSTQEQQHLGQIISGGHIIIAQPLTQGASTADSSLNVVENVPKVTNTVNKIVDASAPEQDIPVGSTGPVATCNSKNTDGESTDSEVDITKKEPEISMDEPVVLSDDDEEFKRQMQEIDNEIERKEKEHDDMRKRKLELLHKRKVAKFMSKVVNEDAQEESVSDKITDLKDNGDKVESQVKNGTTLECEQTELVAEVIDKTESMNKNVTQHPEADCMNDIPTSETIKLGTESSERIKELEENEDTRGSQKTEEKLDEHVNEAEENEDADRDKGDEEDPFEGALVIDLSASSKEHDNSGQLTKAVSATTTRHFMQDEVRDESQDETYSSESENTSDEKYNKDASAVKEMCNGLLQRLEPEVSNNSIEYIPDIHRINPFTGEYDQFDTAGRMDESLDLSNKHKDKAINPARNENEKDAEKMENKSPAKTKPLDVDNVIETEHNKMAYYENISDINQESTCRRKIKDVTDVETLDLSAKPVCVFTFKKSEEGGNSQTLSSEKGIDTSNELEISNKANDQIDSLVNADTKNMKNKECSKCESTVMKVSDNCQYMSKQSSIITANVATSALSALKQKIDHKVDKDNENGAETKLEKENNTDTGQLESGEKNGEHAILNEKENPDPESQETNEIITTQASDVNQCLANNTCEKAKNDGPISLDTTLVTQASAEQASQSNSETVSINPVEVRPCVANSEIEYAGPSKTQPSTRGAYRPRQMRASVHNQESFMPLGYQSPPVFKPPPQQGCPELSPQGLFGPRAGHIPITQHAAMRLQQPNRNVEVPFQNKTSIQIQNSDSYDQLNDLPRRRGHLQSHKQPYKHTRGMYVEIEPAHLKPSPKKIPRGAKPSAAHCQVVNMKEIFKKMNRSFCPIPPDIQQSGPYFKRKQPVFTSPEEQGGETENNYTAEIPRPAHCQRPFSIAGQLIISRKRSFLREYVSPSPTRFSSVPNTPPSPMEEIERSFSARPDIPSRQCESPLESTLPSQRPISADITSPLRAHAKVDNLSSNNAISTVHVLRPPALYNGEDKNAKLHADAEVIDLTCIASPKLELENQTTTGSIAKVNTENVVQSELNAAVSAKRQRLDTHCFEPMHTKAPPRSKRIFNSSYNQGLGGHEVMNPTLQLQAPHHQPIRMQAPLNRTMRVRQLDYSASPRQVLSSVPVQRPMPPTTSIPYPLVQQALFSDQGNPAPVRSHPLQEQATGNHGDGLQHLHLSHRGHPRPIHDQLHQRTMACKHNANMNAMGRPSAPSQIESMNFKNAGYQNNAGMYPHGIEVSQRRHYNGSQTMTGHGQAPSDRLQHPFLPPHPQDLGQGRGGQVLHLLQQHPQAQIMSSNASMMSSNTSMMSPNVSMMSPNVTMISPNTSIVSPNTPNHYPNNLAHSPLPPSPRGDVPQNWSQIQKMQQIRAHNLRNRQLHPRPQTSVMGGRPGYQNNGHQGMAESHNQDQTQRYHLCSKQPPMVSPPFRQAPFQGIEQGKPTPPYPVPHSNQSFHIQQMAQPGKPMSAPQMTAKHQQLGPPALNRYYPMGQPEALFISHNTQVHPPNITQAPGHNRANPPNLTKAHGYNRANPPSLIQTRGPNPRIEPPQNIHHAQQNRQQAPVFNQGYPNQALPSHSVRTSTPVTYRGHSSQHHQISPGTSYHTNNPSMHHQGQIRETSPRQQQLQLQGKGRLDTQEKTAQELEEENMPHLQQVHGACVLCGKYSLYLCSSCKQIWYCSPECQLKHWQTHVNECKGPAG